LNKADDRVVLKRLALMVLVAGTLVWSGCDSNDEVDDITDSESDLLVGTWIASTIKAGPIDVKGLLGLSMSVTLREDGTGRLQLSDETAEIADMNGVYTVDEVNDRVTMSSPELEEALVLQYVLIDDNNIEMSLDGSTLGDLGLDLGEVGAFLEGLTITIEAVREGSGTQ